MKEKHLKRRSKRRIWVTPSRMIRAIVDTGGIVRRISENLGCSYGLVFERLKREGKEWDKVRKAYRFECERIVDSAELTIIELINQRHDLGVAERAAKWYLSKKRSIFRDQKNINIGGTDIPIQVESNVQIDIEKLPLEVRKLLLAAMEEEDNA